MVHRKRERAQGKTNLKQKNKKYEPERVVN